MSCVEWDKTSEGSALTLLNGVKTYRNSAALIGMAGC